MSRLTPRPASDAIAASRSLAGILVARTLTGARTQSARRSEWGRVPVRLVWRLASAAGQRARHIRRAAVRRGVPPRTKAASRVGHVLGLAAILASLSPCRAPPLHLRPSSCEGAPQHSALATGPTRLGPRSAQAAPAAGGPGRPPSARRFGGQFGREIVKCGLPPQPEPPLRFRSFPVSWVASASLPAPLLHAFENTAPHRTLPRRHSTPVHFTAQTSPPPSSSARTLSSRQTCCRRRRRRRPSPVPILGLQIWLPLHCLC